MASSDTPAPRIPGSVRDRRNIGTVREYLTALADSPGNAVDGKRTIEHVADDMGIQADDLREFRDGNSSALGQPVINMFAAYLGQPGNAMLGLTIDDSLGFADPSNGGWYGSMMAEEAERAARLRTFHLIDKTRPETKSAFDAWADLATTGNVGDIARYAGGYEAVVLSGAQAAKNVIADCSNDINDRLLPDDKKWLVVRGVVKYGNQYGELSFEPAGGRFRIASIEPRHARTMYVVRDPNDGSYDFRKAYKQVMPGRDYNDPVAYFPEYKIVNFANTLGWGDNYGESILDCCLRSYIQLEAMEAGMLTRRLERASQKMKHFVDVGLMEGGDREIQKYVTDYRTKMRKVRTVDGSRNMRMQKISMPDGEDYIVPKRDKDSPSDVIPIAGDQYIEEIGDVMHFFNKYISGLGPPKVHLGYDSGESRGAISDQHIVWSRKVRRMQIKFIAAMNQIYYVQMILQGIDPRKVRFQVFPPSLGTRDELIRAQVQLAHATTCRYLSQAFSATGKQPSVQWFLQKVCGFDDEALEDLNLTAILQPPKGGNAFKNDPPTGGPKELRDPDRAVMAAVSQTNPYVMETVEHLQFMLEERAIELRLPSAAARLPSVSMPFARNFTEIVKSMGITNLRDI